MKNGTMRAVRLWCLVVLLVSVPAVGEVPATQPASSISGAQLKALDSDDYAVREAVSQKLLADDALTASAVAEAYARATTLEQKHRLMEVARHQYLRAVVRECFGPARPGSIGVTIGVAAVGEVPGLKDPGIRITGTFPGFPAYTVLRRGDILTAVDGKGLDPLGNDYTLATEFRTMINTKTTGQEATLTVWRDGKTLEVKVKVASMDALSAMYGAGVPVLRDPVLAAWTKFANQMARQKPGDAPIEVDMTGLKTWAGGALRGLEE